MNKLEMGLGIDLGSSAVRIGVYSLQDDRPLGNSREEVRYYHHPNAPLWEYTQSSTEIMAAIKKGFSQLNLDQYVVRACGVSATCSLAIFVEDGDSLIPFSGLQGNDEQNVVFWMDSTSKKECQILNEECEQAFKDVMGGGFVPEMAIPKIMRLKSQLRTQDSQNQKIIVMDLHRFIAHQLAEWYGWDFQRLVNRPNANGVGHDGELSGWDNRFYDQYLKLPSNIRIGPEAPNNEKSSQGPPVQVASCIDCYSSWLSLCSPNLTNSLFIVGGTSTCFILAANSQGIIPGVWGPFTNILPGSDSLHLYEAGQSCTGRLVEHLLETHPASCSFPKSSWPSLLEKIENSIVRIEEQSGCSIHMQTKHMFFYGDLLGNRTPYADPLMSGSFIGETIDVSFTNLIHKYICVLEFLAFQIKYMISMFDRNNGQDKIEELRICGSQAKNKRLLTLISLINNNMPINLPIAEVDLSGVSGAYLLGKCAMQNTQAFKLLQECTFNKAVKGFTANVNDDSLSKLLEAKYEIHLDMAKRQIQYRRAVDKSLELSR